MIVTRDDDAYRFVTQPEHAAQVGRFCERWGGGAFVTPEPVTAVRMACYLHDAGWADYDLTPHLTPDGPESTPQTVHDDWAAFYDHGIRVVAERDPYAGLLCALHGAGVRRQRYGLAQTMPDRSTEYAAFIDDQETRQRALLEAASADPRYAPHIDDADRTVLQHLHDHGAYAGIEESRVWRGYRLLQLLDQLSLYCCTAIRHEATTLGPAPTAPGTPDVTLKITPDGDATFRLAPFPFAASSVVAPVRTRTVAVEAFADEQELTAAYYDAPVETISFRFVASDR